MNRNNVMKVGEKMFLQPTWRGTFRAILYVLPALIILGTFNIYPIIKSVLISLYTDDDFYNNIVHSYEISNFTYLFKNHKFVKFSINIFFFVFVVVGIFIIFFLFVILY